jgi:D-arabinose 1-dehydrogenase-like Zn-dependent alcohol dehydrogenase
MTSYETTAIGKKSKEGNFEKFVVGRVRTSDFDVDIDIKYCGLCHTDLHLVTFPAHSQLHFQLVHWFCKS